MSAETQSLAQANRANEVQADFAFPLRTRPRVKGGWLICFLVVSSARPYALFAPYLNIVQNQAGVVAYAFLVLFILRNRVLIHGPISRTLPVGALLFLLWCFLRVPLAASLYDATVGSLGLLLAIVAVSVLLRSEWRYVILLVTIVAGLSRSRLRSGVGLAIVPIPGYSEPGARLGRQRTSTDIRWPLWAELGNGASVRHCHLCWRSSVSIRRSRRPSQDRYRLRSHWFGRAAHVSEHDSANRRRLRRRGCLPAN